MKGSVVYMDILLNNGMSAVLRTMIYYDIFNYPLTEGDILNNCMLNRSATDPCRKALQYLVDRHIVYRLGDYYSLNNRYDAVERRIKGNQKAIEWEKKARRFSRLISWFPFVRGISLSGSLSKGFVDDNPDIDYFIITKPNRLWIARTLLILFKKVFLLNSYKYFCLNYFIAQDNMEIAEKNLFTATEIATMIPVFGYHVKRSFYENNQWIKQFYPNFEINDLDDVPFNKSFTLKRFFEFLLKGRLGDKLDTWFMNTTIRHWSKKFGHRFTEKDFLISFKSGKHISKHHPRNFQKIVLEKFRAKQKEIEQQHNILLDHMLVELN